ncbi:site-specific integrase [Hymenobacter mucosus]|uniref:Site-specific recombinase XerD n=1 Tax=Hymenobacter mucosus TaxID=1411120 RepID=A0A239AAP3_9BACT|nr:site-specific integrase [Hymenobacter mucosus]SNR92609.1 Site-specific recombinase XerD [Hymenobacter mucosus]
MKTRLRILFLVRKNRTINGRAVINCRLTIKDQPRVNFSTGQLIEVERWDSKAKRVAGTDETAARINRALVKLENDLNDIHADLERQKRPVTTRRLFQLYKTLGVSPLSLQAVYGSFIEERQSLIGIEIANNTQRSHLSRRNKFIAFLQAHKLEDIRPEDFSVNMADKYLHWLLITDKLERSTALKHLQGVDQVLRWAVRREYIEKNPMELYEFKHSAPKEITYLTPEQLEALATLEIAVPALGRVRDCFIFQCWTGLAYSDLAAMDVERDAEVYKRRRFLRIRRAKSTLFKGYECVIPLLEEPERLLAFYGNKMPLPCLQVYNRYLKQVVEMAGLDSKQISSHVGRKTAGVQLLNAGLSMEIVSKVLGHSSIKITEKLYAKLLDRTVVNEFERVFGGLPEPPLPAPGFDSEEGCRVLQFKFSA